MKCNVKDEVVSCKCLLLKEKAMHTYIQQDFYRTQVQLKIILIAALHWGVTLMHIQYMKGTISNIISYTFAFSVMKGRKRYNSIQSLTYWISIKYEVFLEVMSSMVVILLNQGNTISIVIFKSLLICGSLSQLAGDSQGILGRVWVWKISFWRVIQPYTLALPLRPNRYRDRLPLNVNVQNKGVGPLISMSTCSVM